MKTREECLQAIEDEYNTAITVATEARMEADNAVASKEEKIKEINRYFDAVSELPRLQEIIDNPPAEVTGK